MCAIAGLFAYHSASSAPSSERLQQLSEAMRKRGPDAAGQWCSDDRRVRLGHRRLSILDPSAAGNQPMADETSGCVLVFNGEIYNFRDLRRGLQRAGYAFRSGSDTEVLLKGYLQWGESLLQRLRGMFAFALWDPGKQRLWLARDPYGIKPLYYADQGDCFAFASQAKPLREHVIVDARADAAAVVGFMMLGTVPEPYTCYRGIRALPAGHALWVSADGVTASKPYASVAQIWHDAARAPEVLSEKQLLERVRTAVSASVRAHQVADVPVGAFLSAGIDASSLVGLMVEDHATALQTVTLGFRSFKGTEQDEALWAERLAAHYGTKHQTVWIEDSEAEADLPTVFQDMDQPSIDGLNTWLVSKQTAALGLKVVISGVGGDELFGGYTYFDNMPVWHQNLNRMASIPGLLRLISGVTHMAVRHKLVHPKAEGLPRIGRDLSGLYLVRRGLFMPWELPQFLDGEVVRQGLAELSPPAFLKDAVQGLPVNDYAAIASLDACFYLRNQLLRDSDWASMAHSLELRTPLVDFELLRELAPVLVQRPPNLLGKKPLALAPRPALPDDLIRRPKSGFMLPMDRWVQQSDVITLWRANRELRQPNVPWARRMAYSLLAMMLPEVVVH